MKNKVKITPPEGYEVDKDKSTFEEIVFKPIENELPTKWEDFDVIEGHYCLAPPLGPRSRPGPFRLPAAESNKDVWPTRELAEAALALCQLVRYRDAWNEGWVADWNSEETKYTIGAHKGKLCGYPTGQYSFSMAFKSEKLRNKFIETFKDLLETAKPLL